MSTLLITTSKSEAYNYIQGITKIKNLESNPDFFLLDKDLIKVEDIRQIIKDISSKPTHLTKKIILIHNFNLATVSAQNAFLKTLEEGNVDIYLQSPSTQNIIETVISRVKQVKLKIEKAKNADIYDQIANIIEKPDLSDIPKMTKKYEKADIYNNLEIYLKDNLNNINNVAKIINNLYKVKVRDNKINLNTEIQITNIIVNIIANK